MNNPVNTVPFDPMARKYRCCCGCCHSRTGALIIAILEMIGLGYKMFELFYKFQHFAIYRIPEENLAVFWIQAIVYCFAVITILCLMIGICTERPGLLLPYLVWRIAAAVILAILAICILLILLTDAEGLSRQLDEVLHFRQYSYDRDVRYVKIGMIIGVAIVLFFDIWFFCVVRACYLYLKDKQEGYPFSNVTYTAAPQAVLLHTTPAPGAPPPYVYAQPGSYPYNYGQQQQYPQAATAYNDQNPQYGFTYGGYPKA